MTWWTIWESGPDGGECLEVLLMPAGSLAGHRPALNAVGRVVPADVNGRPMRLVKAFTAASHEAAMQRYNDHYGYGPYKPME